MCVCVCVYIHSVCTVCTCITLSQAFVSRVRQADKPDCQTLIGKPLSSGRLHRKLHGLHHHMLSTLKSIARSIRDYGTWCFKFLHGLSAIGPDRFARQQPGGPHPGRWQGPPSARGFSFCSSLELQPFRFTPSIQKLDPSRLLGQLLCGHHSTTSL